MRQEKDRKTVSALVLAACLAGTALAFFFSAIWYGQTEFERLSAICELAAEQEPEAERAVLAALKQYRSGGGPQDGEKDFLAENGYRRQDFTENGQRQLWIMAAVSFILGSLSLLAVLFLSDRRMRRRIEELTVYLENVNRRGTGAVPETREDAFSMLQDEIYKTVTALYQTRDEALRAKDHFAANLANIAHQLKTPVAAASVSLQLLREKGTSDCADRALMQLERLSVLEEALLTLSRMDSGTLKLAREPVDIYTALSLAADNLYGLLKEKDVSVDIPENGCVEIIGDMDWTMEAFLNLMKNCMEHSPRGGRIFCAYGKNPLYAEVSIWDEGAGFEKEDLPHVFERFYRGKSASQDGAGIGLALAESIIGMQNGTIAAKNLTEGGACFEIRFYCH